MEKTLRQLQHRFPDVTYHVGKVFCWSPETKEVLYPKTAEGEKATWSLLHETSHALLKHTNYGTDFELLRLEVLAWERAKELGRQLKVTIDEEHIQDCLDSYRDWIYSRSICPKCSNKSLQQNDLQHYRCYNCHTIWKVTPSRFCRAYRATKQLGTSRLTPFDALGAL